MWAYANSTNHIRVDATSLMSRFFVDLFKAYMNGTVVSDARRTVVAFNVVNALSAIVHCAIVSRNAHTQVPIIVIDDDYLLPHRDRCDERHSLRIKCIASNPSHPGLRFDYEPRALCSGCNDLKCNFNAWV